jgi:hypothetical protein
MIDPVMSLQGFVDELVKAGRMVCANEYCRIPIDKTASVSRLGDEEGVYCDCCRVMLAAINRDWFRVADAEWREENERRIKLKQRLMAGNERA